MQKKIITSLILILLCLVLVNWNKTDAYAVKKQQYLVLVQQKNGSWKTYTDLIEVSDRGYLMVKAKRISKVLGFTYQINKNGTFSIKKNAATYNTYTKKNKEYKYINGPEVYTKTATDKAYHSKKSDYNLCTVSSLYTLVNYTCFNSTGIKEYADYNGIFCFSRYKDIPDTVPIVEIKTTKKPTPTPVPEVSYMKIEGVEFPVRTNYLAKSKVLSDWGGTAKLWNELKQELDGKILKSTKLWYDSKSINFSHQGVGFDGVTLTTTDKGYKITINVKLNGSVLANQNASVVKAMVVTISSKPSMVYEAIYDSFTSTESHGINEDTYVVIGDCKLKVSAKNGTVTYYIKENS